MGGPRVRTLCGMCYADCRGKWSEQGLTPLAHEASQLYLRSNSPSPKDRIGTLAIWQAGPGPGGEVLEHRVEQSDREGGNANSAK